LLGPGPAAFFKDACRLMGSGSPLETTPHLVAHLLREVESALRDVLLPYGFQRPVPCPHCGSRPGSHKKEIRAILAAYGFEETRDAAEAWLRLSSWDEDAGLARLAHRNALGRPRPADDGLGKMWEEMQALLDVVLDRFETRFLESFKALDELLGKAVPSAADAKRLRNNVPNNLVAFAYFFDKLQNPAWLPVLRKEGFFSQPPPPERDEEAGTIGFPPWPESRYLARMAAVEGAQDLILEITLEIPETENVRVYEDLADVALALPPRLAAELAGKARTGLESPHQILLAEKLGALVAHLAKGGQAVEALGLAEVLLEVRPDDRKTPSTDEEGEFVGLPEARARFDSSQYRRILEKHVPALVSGTGLDALKLLARLLEESLRLSSRKGEEAKPDDYSAIWRPAIEDRSERHTRGVKDALVSGVRDAAERIVTDDPSRLPALVEVLEGHGWLVFKRIAFHLLLAHRADAQELIRTRLTNRKLFDESERRELRREYRRLARAHFGQLPKEDQDTILGWIAAGPNLDELEARIEQWEGRPATPEDVTREANRWRLEHLGPIAGTLPEAWRPRYEALVAELGEPDQTDRSVVQTGWVGPTSPRSEDELRGMPVDEIIEFLSSWVPPGGFMGPSREGVGRALTAVVAADPERFASEASRFRALHPTYVRSVLEGFTQALGAQRAFAWAPVLGVCRWVVNEPREFPGGGTDKARHHDEDRDWSWTRKTIARMVSSACEKKEGGLSIELRGQVWEIVQSLTEDPEPTPEYEAQYGGTNMDPPTLSINTVRGEAMEGVVQYALWVRRHLVEGAGGEERAKRGFAEMPEVREVLDRHLDPSVDFSPAIRSVYGKFLPWLTLLDREWVMANLARIFPEHPAHAALRDAAWETYIVFSQPYNDTFAVLCEEYERAVERLGTRGASAHRTGDPEEHLAEHLIVFYWRGRTGLDDPPLTRFYAIAEERLRRHVIEFIGRSLGNTESELEEEVRPLLHQFWTRRCEAAQQSGAYGELVPFGWWFSSGKLDEGWAIEQLLAVLRVTKRVEPDFLVLERFEELVRRRPQQVMECLRHMVEGSRESWEVLGWREHLEKILRSALQGPDEKARKTAVELINLLVARGHMGFRDLIDGASG
jgi:hypothetical protein